MNAAPNPSSDADSRRHHGKAGGDLHAEPSAHEAKATLPGPRQAGFCSRHN